MCQTNFVRADRLLSKHAKQYISSEQLKNAAKMMHPTAYLLSVRATEYDPIPRQEAVKKFLTGTNKNEKFYYRLPMEGTTEKAITQVYIRVAESIISNEAAT